MIRLLAAVLFGIAALSLTSSASAEEKVGQKTLTGKITCAKCDLGTEKACATVIVVKDGDKETTYYFDKDSNKKHHGKICQGAKEGTVKGTVKKEGDKMVVSVKEVTFN